MSLTTIVLLLQAVLGLLASPGVAHNSQAQALAQQAVLIATQALEQQTTTVGTVNPVPVVYTVPSAPTTTVTLPAQQTTTLNIGAPDLGSVQTPPASPSCSFTAKSDAVDWGSPEYVRLSWNAQNISDTNGEFSQGFWVNTTYDSNGDMQQAYKIFPFVSVSGASGNIQPSKALLPPSADFTTLYLNIGGASCSSTYWFK